MRIVLDTNVLVRAANGLPGLASELFERCTKKPSTVIASEFLLAEAARSIRYPRVRAVHRLDEKGIDAFLADLRLAAELIIPEPIPFPVTNDPDDDAIVGLAVAGSASILCTRDRHLTSPDVTAFCRSLGIEVVSDLELLTRLRS
jgi:putative PIN family toxin of toxin-antitoxin system